MHLSASLFRQILQAAKPFLAIAAIVLMAAGCWFGLVASPEDYQQAGFVRIMHVHVPAAWMAMGIYAMMAIASAVFLIWRNPVWDIIARSSAPIGAVFCGICLITGMIWARPMWGAWWVWDARLTSMLVLMGLYIGYIMLHQAHGKREAAGFPLACLALIGAVNLPIIKFSVEWWNSLHQPASVFRAGGAAIHPDMLVPLMIMALGFVLFYGLMLSVFAQALMMERSYWRKLLRDGKM